jgi:hypothetical protein
MDSNMATARVRKFYFDYEDLSKLDRTMKQFVPFWIWTYRNLPLQLENMWLNPKPYLLYNSFVRNIRDKESEKRSPLPSFIQEVGGFKLPGLPAYAAPDLNFTRVPQLISQLGNVKKLGTNLNPLLRIPIEQAIGQNLYNDKEIVSGQADMGGTMRLGLYQAELLPGSIVATVYGATSISERHRHRYEVNNKYRDQISSAGLVFSGIYEQENLVEFVELPKEVHPYYVGTQAHPELRSRPTKAHPLFTGLVAAAIAGKK